MRDRDEARISFGNDCVILRRPPCIQAIPMVMLGEVDNVRYHWSRSDLRTGSLAKSCNEEGAIVVGTVV